MDCDGNVLCLRAVEIFDQLDYCWLQFFSLFRTFRSIHFINFAFFIVLLLATKYNRPFRFALAVQVQYVVSLTVYCLVTNSDVVCQPTQRSTSVVYFTLEVLVLIVGVKRGTSHLFRLWPLDFGFQLTSEGNNLFWTVTSCDMWQGTSYQLLFAQVRGISPAGQWCTTDLARALCGVWKLLLSEVGLGMGWASSL